ncbi:MAG: acetylxylan esterase [Pirellulaceae bacterium]
MHSRPIACCLIALSFMSAGVTVRGQDPKLNLISLDSHFPMAVPADKEAVEKQNEHIRKMIRLACGLIPSPPLAEPKPVIHNRREFDGYSVEALYFESLPGLYVTGSLYRPSDAGDSVPIVVCPHGHWRDGRFGDAGEASARQSLASGADRFEAAARNHIQARCVQFARMGCMAIAWDMIGSADNQQVTWERLHGFKSQPAETENTKDGWLLFSPQAESHGQSPLALQIINALQVVRVAKQLPGVDPKRIAITGASGGGTQTFLTAAIEPAIAAAFPAVMVSTGMQGGCTCENACYLRVDGGNIHIASCIVPRWLGLTAADDWTRTMPSDGYPELQQVYDLFGVKNRISLTAAIHFKHNYNHISRVGCYAMLNKAFQLGFTEPVLESDFERMTAEELTVWNDQHPAPPAGLEAERRILRDWHQATQDAIQQTIDRAGDDKGAAFESIVGTAVDAMLGHHAGEAIPGPIEYEQSDKVADGNGLKMTGTLSWPGREGTLSVAFRYPENFNGQVIIVADPQGIAGVTQRLGDPQSELAKLLGEGYCIAACDPIGQQAFAESGKQPLVRQDRLAACFTYGYNRPLMLRQASDLLAMVQFARNDERKPKRIELYGLGEAGPLVAFAGAAAGDWVDACVVEDGDFRFGDVSNIADYRFVPGAARYLDLPGILALHAPRTLTIRGVSKDKLQPTVAMYQAKQASDNLTITP